MNGKRLLLDTNAVISLLQGNPNLLSQCQSAKWVGISIISRLEFLCFDGLTAADRQTFEQFLKNVEIVSLEAQNMPLLDRIITIRIGNRLKLPDAIIAASAIVNGADLVTADKEFAAIKDLIIVQP